MEVDLRFGAVFVSLFLVWFSAATSSPNKQSLGIDPQDLSYYKSNVIKCKDGSKKFTREQLNDEFCDCPDGTDEPGTSACPEGKFYCQNAGHIPTNIFSSRVNDGICDCCDGTDEYDSTANCPNTCWEAGKVAREKLKKKIETYQEGVVIRKKEVAKAKQAYANDEADLAKLKIDEKMLKDLVNKLREQKERIEKIEEEERLKKEKEEKRLRIEENKSNEEDIKADEIQPSKIDDEHHEDELRYGNDIAANSDDTNQAETETFDSQAMEQRIGDNHDDTSKSSDGDVSKVDEASLNKEQVGSDTTEGLSKEELGRLVASRWTGEVADKKTDGIGNVEEQVEQDTGFANEHNGYASEAEDDKAKYYDDDFEDDHDDEFEDDHSVTDGSYTPEEYDKTEHADTTDVSSPSWLDKVQQTVQNVLQAFNFFKAPVNVSDAAHIRKEYDDNNSKLSKVQSRISTLTEKLKHDFGKDKEFYTFYDQCFENKESKYVYKICPFKQASQVEGYSDTRLGRWEKFEESYRVMLFSNGDKCWNGPNRSLKVRLRCGLKNEISEVDEPSRCEYVAFMFTPSVCLEDKLEELERKLKQMNAQQPQIHDEF